MRSVLARFSRVRVLRVRCVRWSWCSRVAMRAEEFASWEEGGEEEEAARVCWLLRLVMPLPEVARIESEIRD